MIVSICWAVIGLSYRSSFWKGFVFICFYLFWVIFLLRRIHVNIHAGFCLFVKFSKINWFRARFIFTIQLPNGEICKLQKLTWQQRRFDCIVMVIMNEKIKNGKLSSWKFIANTIEFITGLCISRFWFRFYLSIKSLEEKVFLLLNISNNDVIYVRNLGY